ncbi:1-deoxy-D-xylulose-5-phosphate synthase [Candidatus Izimaplasma bacterium HR1]|jgi:transketolase|uniref:transketolase family protein n=1 Tax=Candidatus Izimoplasma sp. HR1 TaxID=1541959 RepID=UPI0004F659E1|nr:1-deoxy-D-xylulose-5-phosphate synthase [Candidatus Izimaplasma bacterium HR1]
MSVKILPEAVNSPVELRNVYAETLNEIIADNKKVMALEADLVGAIKTGPVAEKNPNNFINCGIMEANMVGVASGLSVRGLVPYMHTFGPFATRRCYDQLFLSIGYSGLNLKVIGSDAGVSAQHNGGTHMPFEDLGLMRLIPEATVMVMSDHVMFKDILKQTSKIHGLQYIRIVRKNMAQLYAEGSSFEIGKGIVLKEGTDATIIANGIMLEEALGAREILAKEGISAAVIDMFTIKPIDQSLLLEYAKKTKLIVTAENHNVIGGLGSAVLEALETETVKVKRIGVQDRYGQVGTQDFLQKEYNLTKEDIVKAVKENL